MEDDHPGGDGTRERSEKPPIAGKGCRSFAIAGFVAVAMFIGLLFVFSNVLREIVLSLCIGWCSFLIRTIPQITGNLSIAGMALLCSVFALVLGHVFFRWLVAARARNDPNRAPARWKFAWTFCGFLSLLVLFLIGMAAGGIVHQIGWIASSPEPMVESDWERSGYGRYNQQLSLVSGFEMSMHLADSDLTTAAEDFRDAVLRRDFASKGRTMLEDYQVFVILDETDRDKQAGLLSFPRVRPSLKRWSGMLYLEGEPTKIKTESDLQKHLEKYRDRLMPL